MLMMPLQITRTAGGPIHEGRRCLAGCGRGRVGWPLPGNGDTSSESRQSISPCTRIEALRLVDGDRHDVAVPMHRTTPRARCMGLCEAPLGTPRIAFVRAAEGPVALNAVVAPFASRRGRG
jgi:hypothetical protein